MVKASLTLVSVVSSLQKTTLLGQVCSLVIFFHKSFAKVNQTSSAIAFSKSNGITT